MAEELYVPKLGQTVEEVTIIRWLVADGAKVKQGQEVVEVQTDKAIFQVESTASGHLHIGPYKEGDVVPVLTVVALVGAPDEVFKAGKISLAQAVADVAAKSGGPAPAPATAAGSARAPAAKVFASPRARKRARQSQVALDQVAPTGGSGTRVTERDVLAYLEQRTAAGSLRHDVSVPVERGAPTERLTMSAHAAAHATLTMVVDFGALDDMKDRASEQAQAAWGFAPGYTDYLCQIVATALRRFPYVNARLQGDRIERLADINIGVAVDTDQGQLIPVIRNADRKGLRQIGAERRALVERARQGTYVPEDMAGATFTLCNLGMYDVEAFTPTINPPETAVLGVGLIAPRQVVREGMPAVRLTCTLSMSFDQRLVDSAPAARFLRFIKQLIEQPALWLAYTT